MPDTAHRFQVKDPFDAEENIKGGMAYLRWLLAYFRGDIALVAAAYNSGERGCRKLSWHSTLPGDAKPCTKNLYNNALHPYQSGIVGASPMLKNAESAKNKTNIIILSK